jgi:Cdc6-like AAA superfamily ATPase
MMVRIFFPLSALVLLLLHSDGSLGKQQVCRQNSPIANGKWGSGDTFAYCALKNGQKTLKEFSNDFSHKDFALIGHRENVDSLRRIFSSWISNGVCQQSWKQKTFFQPCFKPQKPLFLHLSGPSGVGKTLFSDRVSSVLFKERRTDEHDQQRELHHCGHFMYYLSSLQNNSDFVDFLDAVHQQLHYCPFSIFTLDDLHLANKRLLVNFVSHLMNGSVPSPASDESESASISSAIFVFTSNFGGLHAKQSAAEARNAAKAAIRVHFDDDFRTADSKLRDFLQNVFSGNVETFLPLQLEELAEVALSELSVIQQELHRHNAFQDWVGSLKCDKNCSIHLADACLHNRYDCASRMVHGLKHFLTDELYLLMFELKSLSSLSSSEESFNNSDMHVVIVLDELQLQMVKIPVTQRLGASRSIKHAEM